MIAGGGGAVITVPIKPCCRVMAGEVCDCAEFAAQAAELFAKPIVIRFRRRDQLDPTNPTTAPPSGGQP